MSMLDPSTDSTQPMVTQVTLGDVPARVRPQVSNQDKHYTSGPVVRELWGPLDAPDDGPQAFLVERFPPESRFGAHFHAVDQFQVFVGATGAWYQRHGLTSPVLHYADAYTTYGPFGTSAEPMSFFTFRPACSNLTAFMPGSRDKLRRRGRRNLHIELAEHLGSALDGSHTEVRELIRPDDDGLSAHLVRLEAGDTVQLPPSNPASAGEARCIWERIESDAVTGFRPSHFVWHGPAGGDAVVGASGDRAALVMSLRFPAPFDS